MPFSSSFVCLFVCVCVLVFPGIATMMGDNTEVGEEGGVTVGEEEVDVVAIETTTTRTISPTHSDRANLFTHFFFFSPLFHHNFLFYDFKLPMRGTIQLDIYSVVFSFACRTELVMIWTF